MCAIYGIISGDNSDWLLSQRALALQRGKDLINYRKDKLDLYHTRLATNDSPDTYPIRLENSLFAMNGIVSASHYKELMKNTPIENMYGYTVDSAYFLRQFLDNEDWSQFDSDNYVFAFWLVNNNSVYIGNKDFPLYYEYRDNHVRFSSFPIEEGQSVGNKVFRYNRENGEFTKEYEFKNLVYSH